MPIQTEKREKNLRRLKGRVARSRSIGTKLTPDEEGQILAAAEAEGKAPSEWARDLLLRGAVISNRREMEMHLFTELVGIQNKDKDEVVNRGEGALGLTERIQG